MEILLFFTAGILNSAAKEPYFSFVYPILKFDKE